MDLNLRIVLNKDYTREMLNSASLQDTDCSYQICLAPPYLSEPILILRVF
jgi:hypothetical protein